jgi:hypothetical protein
MMSLRTGKEAGDEVPWYVVRGTWYVVRGCEARPVRSAGGQNVVAQEHV